MKADMILVVDSISARRSRLGSLPPRLLRPCEQHRSDHHGGEGDQAYGAERAAWHRLMEQCG